MYIGQWVKAKVTGAKTMSVYRTVSCSQGVSLRLSGSDVFFLI